MTELFHFMTSDDLRLLAEKAKRVTYASGEVILNEGSDAHGIFVLRSGRVRIEKRLGVPPIVVTYLDAGEVFGEMSFIDAQPASASVVAHETCDIDVFGKAEVISLLGSVPGFAARFYQSLAVTLSERLRATTNNLACL